MYSQKLQQFIETHTPVRVVWGLETVKSLAEKAGLEVRRHSDGERWEVISWGGPSDRPERVKISRLQAALGGFGNVRQTQSGEWWGDHPTEKERFYKKLSFKTYMEITWHHRIDGATLEFYPYCRYHSGWYGQSSGMKDPGAAMLDAAGLQPVVVEMPEPAFRLPREPWRHVDLSDGYGAIDEVEEVFASEVEARIQPFIEELKKLQEEAYILLNLLPPE